jgi:tetratricopeptide (TPR) repeat protein
MLVAQQRPNPPAQASAPVEVLLSKARAMEGRGRLDLAAQTWQQVLMADPNQVEALAGLARYASQSGNTAQAKTYVERLRKLDPNNPAITQVESSKITGQQQARLQEAARLVRNQQMEAAVQIYREVFGDNPPPGGWAIAYYEALASTPGGWEAATAGLEKLMQKYPQAGEYRLSLGTLQTYRPATRLEGMKLLESVRGNSLLENKARQAWRQALLWEGQNPNVLPSLKAYLGRYPDPELQKVEAGLPHVEANSATTRSKDENAGYGALQAGNVKEAEARFEAALREKPKSVAALSGLGFVRMKQEDFDSAQELFKAAAAEAPNDKVVAEALEGSHFWGIMKSGSTALTANRAAAIGLFREALQLRPESFDAMQGLAGALMKFNNPQEAAPLFDKLLEQQPKNADLWLLAFNARYQSAGPGPSLAFAKEMPETIREQMERNIEFHAIMAAALSDAGRNPESKQQLQQGIDLANARNRPLTIPVQLQFAGLFLRHGYFNEAAQLFREVTDLDPQSVNAWEGLLTALVQSHQETAAKRASERMSKPVYEAALRRPGFLRSLSAIEMSLGRLDSAEQYLRGSLDLEGAVETSAGIGAKLQLAQIWLLKGQPASSERMLRQLLETQSDNPDVWKTLIAVVHQEGRDEDVMAESARMPVNVRAALTSDSDYTNLRVAALSKLGQSDEALRMARRTAALLKQQSRPVPMDLQIQTAWLLLNTDGDERELYNLLARAGTQPDVTREQQRQLQDVWATWALRRAEAYTEAGDVPRSVAILESAAKVAPANANLQSGLAGNLLKQGENKRALTVYERWGMRGANAADYTGAIGAALSQKDRKSAEIWLDQALRKWPGNGELLSLAGKLAADAGDYTRAQNYWSAAARAMRTDELASAKARAVTTPAPAVPEADPVRDLGQLLIEGEQPAADKEPTAKQRALPPARTAPVDPPIARSSEPLLPTAYGNPAAPLPMLGATRDFSEPLKAVPAPMAWNGASRSASAQTDPAPAPLFDQPRVVPVPSSIPPVQQQARSDVSAGWSPSDTVVTPLPQIAAPARMDSPRLPAQPFAPEPVTVARAPKPLPAIPELLPDTSNGIDQKTERQPLREVEDELAAIEARNTPVLSMGGTVTSRSGDAGFERLLVQQAELSASAVIGDRIRVSAIAHPVYLDGGTPDGLSDKRFGLAPAGVTFPSQSSGGVGGEFQLSTNTFGLHVGSTPREFLVSNFIGGIRFRPGNGPITLMADRDTVKDSFLSYAGSRDPISNRIWGGVVANSAGVLANFGTEASGFYAGAGFQYITGSQVADNKRVDGNAGAYWRLLKMDSGSLTAGFNITGMHYEKNLRFFTLGQGGYFSPQQYLLFNVPVQWKGNYKGKLQYVASGSLGSQHFQEDSSPYFPTLPTVQGKSGPIYPKQAVTGANYSLDLRLAYQLTPHWVFGAILDMNNARNYNSQTAAIYLNYSVRARPASSDLNVPSIPDWRGSQLLQLH